MQTAQVMIERREVSIDDPEDEIWPYADYCQKLGPPESNGKGHGGIWKILVMFEARSHKL